MHQGARLRLPGHTEFCKAHTADGMWASLSSKTGSSTSSTCHGGREEQPPLRPRCLHARRSVPGDGMPVEASACW